MIPLEKLANIADEISETEAALAELRTKRAQLIREARKTKETWKTIAAHAGLTEHGTRKAIDM